MAWFLYDNGLRHERVKFRYFWVLGPLDCRKMVFQQRIFDNSASRL